MKNLIYIRDNCAAVYLVGPYGGNEIVTCRLNKGKYVRVNDGKYYRQICVDGHFRGNAVTYDTPDGLAKSLNARLYKTESGYDRAIERLHKEMGW